LGRISDFQAGSKQKSKIKDPGMSKVLIIGAGGVGQVVTHKCAQNPEIFSKICLASRTKEKCDRISDQLNVPIQTAQVDADDTRQTIALIEAFQPQLVINVALPYQDLTIMEACLATKVNYLDTANYEPRDEAKFCYQWQWDYQERFYKAGIMALLGSGFDPGVTNVFTAWAWKHHFDEMHTLDIIDCNAGEHGQPFATNFNPEINIREVTANGRYFKQGEWIETEPLSVSKTFDFPEGIGPRKIYLMYHEELESLTHHFPEICQARFWMTFSDSYLTHLKVLENVGMTRIDPVMHQGRSIVPLQFLKTLLPDPGSLGPLTTGRTCIGCLIKGIKDGRRKTYYIYNICRHEKAYQEVQAQAISYTTGVPAMIGAKMMLTGTWRGQGIFNMEQFDPAPFMQALNQYGLPWTEIEL
jgi:saccharopine dehydrogenase (NAD+, L-lysine-forming)